MVLLSLIQPGWSVLFAYFLLSFFQLIFPAGGVQFLSSGVIVSQLLLVVLVVFFDFQLLLCLFFFILALLLL